MKWGISHICESNSNETNKGAKSNQTMDDGATEVPYPKIWYPSLIADKWPTLHCQLARMVGGQALQIIEGVNTHRT